MKFCYTHRSVPYSAIIRETSSCSRWEQIQRPIARHYAESETLEHIALFGMTPPNIPRFLNLLNPMGEETECKS